MHKFFQKSNILNIILLLFSNSKLIPSNHPSDNCKGFYITSHQGNPFTHSGTNNQPASLAHSNQMTTALTNGPVVQNNGSIQDNLASQPQQLLTAQELLAVQQILRN